MSRRAFRTQTTEHRTLREHVAIGATVVDAITSTNCVERVMRSIGDQRHHLVVTPNVDHIVRLERDEEFAAAYRRASMRVVDGAPLMALARLSGRRLPERITGVDLTTAVLDAAARAGRSVYLLGGAPDVLDAAVARVRAQLPSLRISGWAAPAIDLDVVTPGEEAALRAIAAAKPDILLLFLGAPKQEKWYWRRVDHLPPCVALAVGGTVEILAGAKQRAPAWAQRVGMEWLWRLAQDPRRLWRRYLVDDAEFIRVAARQLLDARRRAA
jgi:N-acetylglucosaminyldiphosphoundecaprenol N-acetyl-beta-D-mannosaminyltransferase